MDEYVNRTGQFTLLFSTFLLSTFFYFVSTIIFFYIQVVLRQEQGTLVVELFGSVEVSSHVTFVHIWCFFNELYFHNGFKISNILI